MFNRIVRAWTDRIMQRQPDVIIGDRYLYRWHVVPRNRFFNVYLHRFIGSDGPVLHDHPWRSLSYMVRGVLIEHDAKGQQQIPAGRWRYRSAKYAHRLQLPGLSRDVVTLFITGPVCRVWGFNTPGGWRPHWEVDTPARSAEQ